MSTTSHTVLRRVVTAGAAALALAPVVALAPATQASQTSRAGLPTRAAGPSDSLAAIRVATARYHDVDVALADGYLPSHHCVASPAGTMGLHYVNPALAAGPVDLRRPSVLLYLPGDDGPELAGVEWVTADADQDPGTDADRPSLLGVPFDGPMPGHEPGQPVHYDLHAWVWTHNPAGMFAPFNPAATC